MRYSLRTLFALTTVVGLLLAFIVLPMLDYRRQLAMLQELAAAKRGYLRTMNGRPVAIEFYGPALNDKDLARINWRRFSLKMVLLYQCHNVTDKGLDAMQLDGMTELLYVDVGGSGVTGKRLAKLFDRRQCTVSGDGHLFTHPRVTLEMLNSF
jgi:hypothetical protein